MLSSGNMEIVVPLPRNVGYPTQDSILVSH